MARISDAQLTLILDALTELKADLNALRADFRSHDHSTSVTSPGVYEGNSIRISGASSVNTLKAGAETNSAVSASIPTLSDLYSV